MSDWEVGLLVASVGAIVGGLFALFGWSLINGRRLRTALGRSRRNHRTVA